ncbi:DUF899 family protein [Pseudomonadota bacterium]
MNICQDDRELDALSHKRRELPWVKLDKNFDFEGLDGVKSILS